MMNSFMSDLRMAMKMVCARVVDEDDMPVPLWEKLILAFQILCRMIEVQHERKR